MAKIGVLYGMEEIVSAGAGGPHQRHGCDRGDGGAPARWAGCGMAEPSGYDVIVDRISHDIPFYRSFLKNAVLTGTQGDQQSVLVERRR